MIESVRTKSGRISVISGAAVIHLVSRDALKITQTHALTVEQCHVLIHALARAIESEAKGGAV